VELARQPTSGRSGSWVRLPAAPRQAVQPQHATVDQLCDRFVNDSPTHTNGHGSAQDREGADYYQSPASHRPDIEAIEIRLGVVDIYNVKIRDVGVIAIGAEQLSDFKLFNRACTAQVQRCFDPPPSELAWNRHIDAALRNAVRVERIDTPAPHPRSREKSAAQFVLEKVLAETLDRHGEEIKINGTDAVRAVRKDEVEAAFKPAYLATHADTNPGAVGQAWRRALKHPVAAVVEGSVNGEPYLWRSAPSSRSPIDQ